MLMFFFWSSILAQKMERCCRAIYAGGPLRKEPQVLFQTQLCLVVHLEENTQTLSKSNLGRIQGRYYCILWTSSRKQVKAHGNAVYLGAELLPLLSHSWSKSLTPRGAIMPTAWVVLGNNFPHWGKTSALLASSCPAQATERVGVWLMKRQGVLATVSFTAYECLTGLFWKVKIKIKCKGILRGDSFRLWLLHGLNDFSPCVMVFSSKVDTDVVQQRRKSVLWMALAICFVFCFCFPLR